MCVRATVVGAGSAQPVRVRARRLGALRGDARSDGRCLAQICRAEGPDLARTRAAADLCQAPYVADAPLGCPVADAGASSPAGAKATSDLVVDLGSGVTMEFVEIPPGTFTMGSNAGADWEKPPHSVTISSKFDLARYEVSQGQWRAVMGRSRGNSAAESEPVVEVSWYDCQEFLEKLNKKIGGTRFVLPSEAQWEYACRAGTTTKWCCGDDEGTLRGFAWYAEIGAPTTHPIGREAPNAWGLYDLHGNVWEWCEDSWHDSYAGAPKDGGAWVDAGSSERVFRGGSGRSQAAFTRSSARGGTAPEITAADVGLRVARLITGK